MSRTEKNTDSLQDALRVLRAWQNGEASQADALASLQSARSRVPESSPELDDLLLSQISMYRTGLQEADAQMEETQTLLDKYSEAPLIPALFLYMEQTPQGEMALVACGNGRRIVALSSYVNANALHTGESVYLSSDQSVLVKTADSRPQSGEIANFERYTSDARIVLRSTHSDEKVVVEAASSLQDIALRPGDLVRWDRAARLCQEKMDDSERNPYLLEQVEDIPLESIGGQQGNLNRIQEALLNSLLYPDRTKQYRLPCSNTLLLYGPPGNGKTCMTRAVFAEIQRRSGKKVFLSVVNASSWESMWVGQTQANITALFTSMRQAAAEGNIAVLFIDEIEAVARTRGSYAGHHDDKALSTLLNEMNGFQQLHNVSVVGACNRKDLLDSALLSRFGDQIPVHRPDIRGAKEIFSVHLEEDIPYQACQGIAGNTRTEMIERAVSRLYAPNAESEICVLKLRDGKTRTVAIKELVSGRLIQQICHSVKRRALQREINTGDKGLRLDDMEVALAEAIQRLITTLTPQNVHDHLESLPEDEHVVGVDPILRRVVRPLRYMSLA